MNFSTLVYGAIIGYIAYKTGERVEKNRQIREDSTYGLTDLVDEILNDF